MTRTETLADIASRYPAIPKTAARRPLEEGHMKDYVVRWTIDVQAENEEDAALEAAAAHSRKGSLDTVYEVAEADSQFYRGYDVAKLREERKHGKH